MELNKAQLEAVTTDKQKVLVAASAACGKTRVIMERIQYLLDHGVDAKEIVAITFTNLAAHEMHSRLTYSGKDLFIGTIHSYANQHLLKNGIDTSSWIQTENFDRLLEKGSQIKFKYSPKYLLVDEFQDLSDLEYSFISNINAENTFFVGDPNQSIYGFRGSNFHIFISLMTDNEYTVYYLLENYRCGKRIMDFASTKLDTIREKCTYRSIPKAGYLGEVYTTHYTEALDELIADHNYKDWFILTRTNYEIEVIIDLLNKEKIPYVTFKKRDCTPEEINGYLQKNAVKVLTIHAAKGLESEKVIVIGANNWNDEEKRISYVAATRAKKQLYWCSKIAKKTNKITHPKMIEF